MKSKLRIKNSNEFSDIIKTKKSEINHKFVVYHKPKKFENCRVGISVGKKLGNAVVRNKVKRQLRMMLQDILKYPYSFDSIIIVRYQYFKSDYTSNKADLKKIFDKIEKRSYLNATIK